MTENEKPIDEIIGEGADAGPGSKPETESAPSGPAGDASADRSWTYSALKDERGKRQALAERNAELEAQLQSYAQQQQTVDNDVWANPEEYISRQVIEATLPTTLRASRAEFVAEHGRAALKTIEDAVGAAMESGHPDMPLLREAMRRSDDPVAVVASWYESTGRAHRRRAMPSNFASARNVGARSGPAWSGPTPLDDIFDRGRK